MVNDNISFWRKGFGRFIRWLLFLPIGFVVVSILQALPPLAFELARSYKPEFSFLLLIVSIIAVLMFGGICWTWCIGVFMTPYISCGVIAPNNKVGSVIFGTLFCLSQGLYILRELVGHDSSWFFIIYQIVFTGVVIWGTIHAYKEEGPKATTLQGQN